MYTNSSNSQKLVSKIPYLAEPILLRRCHGLNVKHESDMNGVTHRRSSCRIKTKREEKIVPLNLSSLSIIII